MRLRNIPGAKEEMVANEFVYTDEELKKGKWREEVFKNNNPLHIEEPDVNFLGIEKYSSVLLKALKKLEDAELDNLRLIRMDADNILDAFAEREVDKIYLNFSDPWPKDRHAKRRLTSDRFLGKYEKILVKGGLVEFESIKECGWELVDYTFDLHNDPERLVGNICTEYELKFSEAGNPICKLIARNVR